MTPALHPVLVSASCCSCSLQSSEHANASSCASPCTAACMAHFAADHAGPCEPCPPPTGGNDALAKLLSCEESGYRKPVTCVLGKNEDAPLHEVPKTMHWGCARVQPPHIRRGHLCTGRDASLNLRPYTIYVNAQVMLEAFHAGKHQAAEQFDSYAPCGAENGAGLSVAAFEWLCVAMLSVSAPVMLWRKWGLRTLLPL